MYEQQKLQEANYFFSRMCEEVNNPDPFTYNLSAFLSSARSVLQFTLEEAKKSGGQTWYDNEVSQNNIFQFFKDKRDVSIHRQPVKPSVSVKIALQGTLHISGALSITKIDGKGNIVEKYSSPSTPSLPNLPEVPPIVTYTYNFADWSGTEDVITLAKKYIENLRDFVKEGVTQGFLTS